MTCTAESQRTARRGARLEARGGFPKPPRAAGRRAQQLRQRRAYGRSKYVIATYLPLPRRSRQARRVPRRVPEASRATSPNRLVAARKSKRSATSCSPNATGRRAAASCADTVWFSPRFRPSCSGRLRAPPRPSLAQRSRASGPSVDASASSVRVEERARLHHVGGKAVPLADSFCTSSESAAVTQSPSIHQQHRAHSDRSGSSSTPCLPARSPAGASRRRSRTTHAASPPREELGPRWRKASPRAPSDARPASGRPTVRSACASARATVATQSFTVMTTSRERHIPQPAEHAARTRGRANSILRFGCAQTRARTRFRANALDRGDDAQSRGTRAPRAPLASPGPRLGDADALASRRSRSPRCSCARTDGSSPRRPARCDPWATRCDLPPSVPARRGGGRSRGGSKASRESAQGLFNWAIENSDPGTLREMDGRAAVAATGDDASATDAARDLAKLDRRRLPARREAARATTRRALTRREDVKEALVLARVQAPQEQQDDSSSRRSSSATRRRRGRIAPRA